MTEIVASVNQNCRKRIRFKKKHSLKIDMTPMVDLGFLLISFFVITAEMSKTSVAELYMPKDGIETGLPQSLALTVMLSDNNQIYYYHGNWESAFKNKEIYQTGYSYAHGIGNVIRRKQELLDMINSKNEGRRGFMLIIKADKKASYQNIVDILDEVMINDVKKYTISGLTQEEVANLSSLRH